MSFRIKESHKPVFPKYHGIYQPSSIQVLLAGLHLLPEDVVQVMWKPDSKQCWGRAGNVH